MSKERVILVTCECKEKYHVARNATYSVCPCCKKLNYPDPVPEIVEYIAEDDGQKELEI